ncbi:MAG: carbon-nitrogen family hydrolase [Microthrixaceae bacterium]
MSVRVALVQLSSEQSEPPPERRERALELTRTATSDAELVVLPELWLAGAFDVAGSGALAAALDGDLVDSFREVARTTATWVHLGSVAERNGEHTHNTSVVVGPDGGVRATYRKRHLFGFDGGEPEVMTAGDSLEVLDTPLGRTGLATCYDLRFPEHYRALVDEGATAFLMASGWPASRIGHWRVLLRARAIEDQAWMVACNGVGTQCGVRLGGRSAVIDPLGEVVAEAGDDETVLTATIEPERAEEWRREFPALGDRR